MRVDAQVARLDGARDAETASEVGGEDRAGEPVLGVVGQLDGVRLVVEGHDGDDGPEDLLAPDPGRGVLDGDDGRRDPPARTARGRAGEGDLHLVEEAPHRVALASGDQRTHLAGLVGGIEHPHALDGGLQVGEELVVGGALDQDARARAAVLAGVVEDGPGCGGGRGRQVGVGEDDVAALAAELQGDPLDLLGTAGHHLLADRGGAGEADLAHERVRHEPLADDRAATRQHGEHVLGQAGLERELTEPDGGQRGQLGGLEHHRVAGGERRREAPAGDRHREVPGHDDADDAQRLVEGQVGAAGNRDLAPEQPLGGTGVVVQAVAHIACLPPRVAPRVAGVAHLELGELLDVRVDDGGEPAQQCRPLARGDGTPGGERLVGGGDRGVGVLEGGHRDVGDRLLGGGVEQGEDVGHGCSLSRRPKGTVGRVRAPSPVGQPGGSARWVRAARSPGAAPSRSPRRRRRPARRRPC